MSGAGEQQQRRVIRGVCFDMDGTLTVPVIDFAYMRQRAGVGPTGDILEEISKWPEAEQARARAAIREVELEALEKMQAMPGMVDLCAFLDQSGIPRALVTRNVKHSVDWFHAHHLPLPPFLPAISRECSRPKPDPDALHHVCESWGIEPREALMVGDSAADDIVFASRAGALGVLLDQEGKYSGVDDARLAGEMRPVALVRSLVELHELLRFPRGPFELAPPARTAAAGGLKEERAAGI